MAKNVARHLLCASDPQGSGEAIGIRGGVAAFQTDLMAAQIAKLHIEHRGNCPEFLAKYLDTPTERQASAAREVLKSPDSALFTVEERQKTP